MVDIREEEARQERAAVAKRAVTSVKQLVSKYEEKHPFAPTGSDAFDISVHSIRLSSEAMETDPASIMTTFDGIDFMVKGQMLESLDREKAIQPEVQTLLTGLAEVKREWQTAINAQLESVGATKVIWKEAKPLTREQAEVRGVMIKLADYYEARGIDKAVSSDFDASALKFAMYVVGINTYERITAGTMAGMEESFDGLLGDLDASQAKDDDVSTLLAGLSGASENLRVPINARLKDLEVLGIPRTEGTRDLKAEERGAGPSVEAGEAGHEVDWSAFAAELGQKLEALEGLRPPEATGGTEAGLADVMKERVAKAKAEATGGGLRPPEATGGTEAGLADVMRERVAKAKAEASGGGLRPPEATGRTEAGLAGVMKERAAKAKAEVADKGSPEFLRAKEQEAETQAILEGVGEVAGDLPANVNVGDEMNSLIGMLEDCISDVSNNPVSAVCNTLAVLKHGADDSAKRANTYLIKKKTKAEFETKADAFNEARSSLTDKVADLIANKQISQPTLESARTELSEGGEVFAAELSAIKTKAMEMKKSTPGLGAAPVETKT